MASTLGIRIILTPYDSGHRSARMGSGPEHLLDNGLKGVLQADRRKVQSMTVESQSSLPAEVATAFELDRLIAPETRLAVEAGEFPLVLSGNCNSSVGTISGAGTGNLGGVWFDAHADFNTPKTTTTGFLDGMGLAIAVVRCWGRLASSIPDFSPLPEANVVLVGTRSTETAEQERLDDSEVAVVGADRIRKKGVVDALSTALDALRDRVDRVYVHLDLDVLNPEKVGPANEFAASLGLVAAEVEEAIYMIRERFTVAAAGIASYDPAFDTGGAILRAGYVCARALVHSDSRD